MKSFLRFLRSSFLALLLLGSLFAIISGLGRFDYSAPRATVRAIYDSEDASVYAKGSGVMIAPRLMLTAAHTVMDGRPRFVGDIRAPVRVLRIDKEKDLALLLVALDCPCARIGVSAPAIDEKVVAVGYPMNFLTKVQVLTEGQYQGHVPGSVTTTFTAPVGPGNSGGGLFSWDGVRWSLVGIVEGVTAAPLMASNSMFPSYSYVPHLAFAVPNEVVRQFLNGRSPVELGSLKPETVK